MSWSKNYTISEYVQLAGEQPTPGYNVTSPEVAARADSISQSYPWMQPQTIMSLAKYNLPQSTIQMAGDAAARRELGQYDAKKNAQGEMIAPVRYAFDAIGWVAKTSKAAFDFIVPGAATAALKGFYQPLERNVALVSDVALKPTVRWSTAVFDLVPETVQSLASMAVGSSNYDLFGLWESTSLATMLDNREQVGDGFFMSQTLREEQAKRARAFRGTIYGNAFTIGRAMFSWAGENSRIYKYGSGVVDAAVMLAVPDPSLYVAKGINIGAGMTKNVLRGLEVGMSVNQALKAGSQVAPYLTKADAAVVRSMLRDETALARLEAGITDGMMGENVDAVKFVQFMQSNPLALNLVDTLVSKTNRMEILEDVFKFEIGTDVADALALATTRSEVISALTKPFTLGGEGVLTGPIGTYRVNKARNSLLKTRWFTQMPKQSIVVAGNDLDNLEAIRNMTLSMRTAGVAEDVIKNWGDRAVQSFSRRGTSVAKYESFGEYNDAVKHVLKANGIEDQVIGNLFERANGGLDKVRSYLVDRMGIETDNGHLRMMAQMLAEHGDPGAYAEFLQRAAPILDDASFAGPAKLVHLLDRTRTMPDARELRRLTRNPLFQKVFDAAGVNMKKLAITSKRAKINVVRYTDELAVRELQAEIDELKSLRGAERTEEVTNEIAALERQQAELTYTEEVKALTGEARLAIDLLDHVQNRIWKPLNLATIGYIMRNGIDAQIRMAFGGVRSLANTNFLDPLEYIHIAIGLPGRGVRYGKSITGVDMTNLGVAKKLRTGETIAEEAAVKGQYIFVGERRFDATAKGRAAARRYSERTGKPLLEPELEAEFMDGVTAASEVQRQLASEIGEVSQRIGFLPSDQIRHQVRTGSFPVFARGTSGSYDTYMHTKGVVEQLQMAHKNESTKIVLRGIQQGKTDQQIAEEVAAWFLRNKSSPAYQNLKALFLQGIPYRSISAPGDLIAAPVNFDEAFRIGNEAVVRQALMDYTMAVDIKSLRELTGKIPELEFMAAYNGIGDLAAATAVPLNRLIRFGAGGGSTVKAGNKVVLDGKVGIVTKIERASEDAEEIATFVPFIERFALDNAPGKSSPAVRKLIESIPVSADGVLPGLPVKVPSEQILRTDTRGPMGSLDSLARGTDYLTGWLFNVLNDTAVRRLERSVTFRQFYYQEIGKHIDRLSLEEGRKLYEDVLAKATDEGKSIREYIGEGATQKNRVSDKIENLGTRTEAKGTLAVGDLDDFARFVGLSKTKELLYDAASRGNLVDSLRIVMPFAQAWKDVLGTYMTLGMQHNIHMVRQFSRVYKGLEQADPDQDGRGFLFRDPQTNEVQFHFPLSGSIAKLFGIDAPLSAPLARLSQGINIYPALGPYAQLAVSQFIPDIPKYDDIKELFLPYGETKLGDIAIGNIPGWARKTFEAAYADTENRTSTYGNVYMETIRALSVNPKYDLSTEAGVNELLADAKSRARVLTMMRAFSQFLGPASGTQEWKVPTDIGDKYVGVLIEELRKMQVEDYDSSIDRFLGLYGDELALYVSSKSRVVRDGVEATEAFGKWERDNRDIMSTYERTGAYFGPMGADYNFTVWERQLEEGSRERIGDRELIKLAQLRIGSARYRSMRKMFPDDPSEKQREVLAAYRLQLNEEYPGFPIRPEYEVGKFANQLDELRSAVQDPRLRDNPIIPQLRTYLAQRDQMEAIDGGLSLRAKKKAPLRARLFALGETLARQNPEFDRIWSRVLSQEVE